MPGAKEFNGGISDSVAGCFSGINKIPFLLKRILTHMQKGDPVSRCSSDSPRNLVGAKAAGTNIYRFRRSVNNSFHPSDIGLPHSVGFTVGMGYIPAECHAFSAYTAFCHISAPPIEQRSCIPVSHPAFYETR